MQRKNFFYRFSHHLKTINTHKITVTANCFKIGLYKQGLLHDLSKYNPIEFFAGVKYYQGNRSPIVAEKEDLGYSLGWLHHKGKNKHHWEYWYDMIEGKFSPIEMPYNYVCEMVCDRVAACKTYQKEKYTNRSALEYFLTRKDRFYMHPATAKVLEELLRDIADNGEEVAFNHIKQSLKK